MSNHIVSLVFKRKVGRGVLKQVLSYMADKSSDDGSGVWCAKTTIADENELSQSVVKKCVHELVEMGLIFETGKRRIGNGFTVEYSINIDAVKHLPPTESQAREWGKTRSRGGHEVTPSPGDPVTTCPRQGHEVTPSGSPGDPKPPLTIQEPKDAGADVREVESELLRPDTIPDVRDQFEEGIWPHHWRAGDNSAKAFIEFEKLSVEERTECVQVMEVAKSSICKDQPNPEYRVGLAKWIREKRFKGLVDAAIALEKNKAKLIDHVMIERLLHPELFKACERARGKEVPCSMDRYSFPKSIIEKARASL